MVNRFVSVLTVTFDTANRKAEKATYTSDLSTTEAPTDAGSDVERLEKRVNKSRVTYSPLHHHRNVQNCPDQRHHPSSPIITHHLKTCQKCLLAFWKGTTALNWVLPVPVQLVLLLPVLPLPVLSQVLIWITPERLSMFL